jgi:hypothetical protein
LVPKEKWEFREYFGSNTHTHIPFNVEKMGLEWKAFMWFVEGLKAYIYMNILYQNIS